MLRALHPHQRATKHMQLTSATDLRARPCSRQKPPSAQNWVGWLRQRGQQIVVGGATPASSSHKRRDRRQATLATTAGTGTDRPGRGCSSGRAASPVIRPLKPSHSPEPTAERRQRRVHVLLVGWLCYCLRRRRHAQASNRAPSPAARLTRACAPLGCVLGLTQLPAHCVLGVAQLPAHCVLGLPDLLASCRGSTKPSMHAGGEDAGSATSFLPLIATQATCLCQGKQKACLMPQAAPRAATHPAPPHPS